MTEAMYYVKDSAKKVKCLLCPHLCVISDGFTGFCGVRKNTDGVLYSLNSFRISSISLDPIEKKPLYRFHPGSKILSIGSVGCNFACPFCQNHTISKDFEISDTMLMDTQYIIDKAIDLGANGNIGVAYTYNEPTVWYETVLDVARACHKNGLLNVIVTNGFISHDPFEELLPYIDAMNIDLKAFNERFYKSIVKGNLNDVKNTIKQAYGRCHIELTTLIIPGENDSEDEMRAEAEFISSISADIPLHLSRFFPNYQMTDKNVTDVRSMHKLRDIASEYLKYVYLGNV